MTTLHVQLLGEFRFAYENGAVLNLSPRLKTLLAYLVLHRAAAQSRQHIAFLLWADSSESQARTNLRGLLKELKRVWPECDLNIKAEGQTLQWCSDAPCVVDVDEFEKACAAAQTARSGDAAHLRAALERAVSLYTGELMPGASEDWLLDQRERLQQLYAESLQRLIGVLQAAGEFREAIVHAQHLLHLDDLREDSYRQLMRLHALNGDRAAVQRVYNQCVAVLQRELGITPSAETRRCYEECMRMEPPHRAPAANERAEHDGAPAGPPPGPHPPPSRPQTPPADRPKHRLAIQLTKDAVTYGLPTAGLGYSVLVLNAPLLVALPLSIATFLGLYFVMNPRSESEQAAADRRDDALAELAQCQSAVAQFRALAGRMPDPEWQARIARIADLADRLIRQLQSEPEASLRDIHSLAHILTQATNIVDLHARLSPGDPGSETARSQFDDLLAALESALDEFAKRAERPDRLTLDVAMRALLAWLKQEGLERDVSGDRMQVNALGHSFMTALQNGDWQTAHGLCAPTLQRQFDSVAELGRILMESHHQPAWWQFTDFKAQARERYVLAGSVQYADPSPGTVSLLAARLPDTGWRLLSFDLR